MTVEEVVGVRTHTAHTGSKGSKSTSKDLNTRKDTDYTPPSERKPFNKPKSKHLS
jgi:hypothetical protein